MLWCLLLAAGVITKYLGYGGYQGKGKFPVSEKPFPHLFGSDFEDARFPNRYRDDFTEKSFTAQNQNNIRLPHGANKQMKYVESFAFINHDKYKRKYQENLHNAWIENQDWRMDYTTFGKLNSYSKPHNPENNFSRIARFNSRIPNVRPPSDFRVESKPHHQTVNVF